MSILSLFFHAVNLFFAKISHFFAGKSSELLPSLLPAWYYKEKMPHSGF